MEGKRNFNGVRRPQPAAVDRRFPAEVIQEYRSLSKRRTAFGDFHDGRAIPVIARYQKINVGRSCAWIRLAIRVQDTIGLASDEIGDSRVQSVIVEGKCPVV